MRWRDTRDTGHLYEKSMHTLCTISEQPLLAEASNILGLKSITHLRTFSDSDVYVALQLFLVILVSDQWTPGINTLLLSTGALGSFTCSGMTLPIYMGLTA